MSFDEGNLLTEQAGFTDTITSNSDATENSQTDLECSEKPAESGLLYQAIFSPGQTGESQGAERATNLLDQPRQSPRWNNEVEDPGSAGFQDWSSFSDISNTVSPAASGDSVAVSWRESESESELLTNQESQEAASSLNLPETVNCRFNTSTAAMLKEVCTATSEGDDLGNSELDGDYSELNGCTELNDGYLKHDDSAPCFDMDNHGPVVARTRAAFNRASQSQITGLQSDQDHLNPHQMLSNECFEAAIRERMKNDSKGKILAKHQHSKTDRHYKHSFIGALKQEDQKEQSLQHQSHSYRQEKLSHDTQIMSDDLQDEAFTSHSGLSSATKIVSTVHMVSTTAIFVAPKSPSITSASSGETSDGSAKKTFSKKYRYSQTAAALQKSGLFTATMKTAELLQRNKILQQELQKLKRETMIFVSSVLSNPENVHLRKMCGRNNT